MPTISCVEPAAAGVHQYLVLVAATDQLLFPHVDSCLAIAFVMPDGRMVGGHVGMQMPTSQVLDPYGNAMAIFNQMTALVNAAPIQHIILVGDANWENDFIGGRDVVQDIINQSGCPNSLFVDTGEFGGGVDVSLNPRRHMVFVQRCVEGQPLVFQQSYAQIVGHNVRRLGVPA